MKHLLPAMGISRSTYYYEIKKTDVIAERNKDLLNEIKDIFSKNKGRYGVRRVSQELIRRGHTINHKRIQRLMHSDQGWQYRHTCYRSQLAAHGIRQSMSRKGNCYDNCIMETFFGRMKNEMFYGCESEYSSFEAFSEAVEQYMNYYNHDRIQKKTKWMPPVTYREASSCAA